MADRKPTSHYYNNLGGINVKASKYATDQAQFLDLRNVDFDVPNALQKRPGQTAAISAGTSGPVIGLFEYKQLGGASWVVAGTDTALFYLASGGLTLLDSGWTNGQPQDMLTFINRLWVANGQKYKWWDGGVSYGILNAGLPEVTGSWSGTIDQGYVSRCSLLSIAGLTMTSKQNANALKVAGYAAFAWVREDGYISPIDLIKSARLICRTPQAAGPVDWTGVTQCNYGSDANFPIMIYPSLGSAPPGVSIMSMYLAFETWTNIAQGGVLTGPSSSNGSATLRPNADLSKFRLFATYPVNGLAAITLANLSSWTDVLSDEATYPRFSGMPFNWFESNTPKYLDVNGNVMFMSGFSNTPSTVWFSDVGEPESIQPEYNLEVRTNDGDRVVGHKTYNNTVLVFKESSFHKILGTTIDDIELVELSTEFGGISNNALVEYNEKLLFLDKKGILQYDGSVWRVISDPIESVFRRMNLSAALEKAVGVHYLYRNQVWFGIPVDGATENNLTIVYDYLINAWTFFDGYSPAAYAFIKSTLPRPTVWRGSYSGLVTYFSETFMGDNGAAITCMAFTHFEKYQGENATNVWRRMFLDVGAASGGGTHIVGEIFSDYDQSTVKATFAMSQDSFQSRAEFGVVGKAVAAKFSHNSATLPFLLNGYSWTKRYLRNV